LDAILEAIIIRDPLVLSPDGTVKEAIALMHAAPSGEPLDSLADARTRCVVVVDQDTVVGLLTERTLLNLIAQDWPLEDIPVRAGMIAPVVTVNEADVTEMATVEALFQQHRLPFLPLVGDRGQLTGLLSRDALHRGIATGYPGRNTEPLRQDQSDQRPHERTLLEKILDIILAGYWDWDIPNQREYLSPGFKRMFGYADNELPNTPETWQTLIFPEDLPGVLSCFEQHVQSRGTVPYYNEVRYRHKNGSTVWVICSGEVIEWDGMGQPLRMIGCHIDITRRKQTEEKLRQRDTHLKAAQRIARLGSWEFDPQTQTITWSDEVFRIFGRDPAAGTPTYEELLQFYPLKDRLYHEETVQTALETRQPYELECQVCRLDGSLRYIQARGEPIVNEAGELVQLVGTVLDITERKHAEEKLLQTSAQLAASNRELEAFAYSVSHDLRAPLRAIDGFSQALLEDYGETFDAEGQDYFTRIRNNISRMGLLIDDLLHLSRVSRSEMRYAQVDLSALAEEVLRELQAGEPPRSLTWAIAPRLIVQADPTLMRVVLTNLLHNAWKFTSHHPTAHIEFGQLYRDGQAVYFVRDDGAGFDMAYVNKLFGVFQRLHNMNEFPGTGIGLATVQRAIHRHGGQVWAEAALEQGATIYFTLSPPDSLM